jgi:hypothetical protein
VIETQIAAVSVEYMLALPQRVPMMTGLTQRSGESFACLEQVGMVSDACHLECVDYLTGHVQRFLVTADAAQVTSYRVLGMQSEYVVRPQDLDAVRERATVGLQSLLEAS